MASSDIDNDRRRKYRRLIGSICGTPLGGRVAVWWLRPPRSVSASGIALQALRLQRSYFFVFRLRFPTYRYYPSFSEKISTFLILKQFLLVAQNDANFKMLFNNRKLKSKLIDFHNAIKFKTPQT